MATQKKVNDPTAAALSAIEEALTQSIHGDAKPEDVVQETPPDTAESSVRMPSTELAQSFGTTTRDQAKPSRFRQDKTQSSNASPEKADTGKTLPGQPANDDRRAVGEILQLLQARQSRAPYSYALTGSITWFVLVAIVLSFQFEFNHSLIVETLLTTSPVITAVMALALCLPALVMFGIASAAMRAREMRVVAQSMTQVALRLAEPTDSAVDSVVSLSQAIRREVAAMGDGVERAVARASELETMVHNEISTLERAYGQNEVRIRALIDELVLQREAISANADQIRASISTSHDLLNRDLEAASRTLSTLVDNACHQVASVIGAKAEQISTTFNLSSDRVISELGSRSTEFLSQLSTTQHQINLRLNDTSEHINRVLNESSQTVTSALNQTGSSVVGEISARGNEVANSIRATSATLNEGLADGINRISTTLMAEADGLVDRIGVAARDLHKTLETRTSDLERGIDESSNRLASILDERLSSTRDTFTQSTDRMVSILSDNVDRMRNEMQSEAQNWQSDLSRKTQELLYSQTERLNALMDDSTGSFVETMNRSVQDIEVKLTTRFSTIETAMREGATNIDTNFMSHIGALDSRFDNLRVLIDDTLTDRVNAMNETLRYGTDFINDSLTQQIGAMETTLDRTSTQINTQLNERVAAINTVFETGTSFIQRSLVDQLSQIQERLGSFHGEINQSLAQRASTIGETLQTGSKSIENTLSSHISSLTNTLGSATGQLDNILASRFDTINATIEKGADSIDMSLARNVEAMETTLSTYSAQIDQTLGNRISAIDTTMRSGASNLDQNLTAYIGKIETTFEQSGAKISDQLNSRLASLEDSIIVNGGALNQKLGDQINHLEEAVIVRGGEISAALSYNLDAFGQLFEGRGAELANRIDAKTDEFTSSIEMKLGQVAHLFSTEGRALADRLTEQARGAAEIVELKLSAIEERTRVKSEEVVERIEVTINQIDERLDQRSRVLTESLDQKSADIASIISQGSHELTTAMDHKTVVLAETMKGRAESVTLDLAIRASEINELLGERANQIAGMLEGNVHNFEERVVNRLEHVSTSLESQTRGVVNVMETASGQITASFGSKIAEISELFDSKGASVIHRLQDQGTSIAGLIVQSGDEAAQAIAGTTAQIQSETLLSLGRLAESSRMVQSIVNSATENLSKLDEGLSARLVLLDNAGKSAAEQTEQSSTLLSQQIEALRLISETGLGETSALLGQLDERAKIVTAATREHARLLEEATQSLGNVESQLTNGLRDRQASFEAMTEMLSSRTHQIELLASSFADSINVALQSAEERAERIGQFIAEASEATSSAFTRQADLVEQGTSSERDRTAALLREVYQQAISEMEDVLGRLTSRFDETTSHIRLATSQIAEEVEAARNEISKGITELPRETQEQASAMRRVVGDQIKALNELSALVVSSGRAADMARSAERPVAPVAPVAPVSRPVAAAPQVMSPPRRESVEPTPVEPLIPRAPSFLSRATPVPQEQIEAPRLPPKQPAPASEPRQAEPATSQRQPGNGWLSDLLDRASRDYEPKQGKRSIDAPEQPEESAPLRSSPPVSAPSAPPSRMTAPSMSMPLAAEPRSLTKDPVGQLLIEIKLLVNPTAVGQLWDRFLAGEAKVTSRSLYTMFGERRFNEARQNYQRDVTFRDAVDSYLSRFEQILSEATVDDSDGSITRKILTSEEGKVYTLLSHSAGRIE